MTSDATPTPETGERPMTKVQATQSRPAFSARYGSHTDSANPRRGAKHATGKAVPNELDAGGKMQPGSVRRSGTTCRTRRFLKKTGVTPEDYEDVFEWQGRRCAICQTDANIKVLKNEKLFAVDHDHTTGRIRAISSNPCNRANAVY